MEKKYTKGPWYAVEYAGFVNIQTEPTYGGANLLDMEAAPEEEVRANANLCAASPAMYEALQMVLSIDGRGLESSWFTESEKQ